jgi:hypothetical protein
MSTYRATNPQRKLRLGDRVRINSHGERWFFAECYQGILTVEMHPTNKYYCVFRNGDKMNHSQNIDANFDLVHEFEYEYV